MNAVIVLIIIIKFYLNECEKCGIINSQDNELNVIDNIRLNQIVSPQTYGKIIRESNDITNKTPTTEYIDTNDRYLSIYLTSEPTDGSIQYITVILTKIFKQMFPPSFRIYSTTIQENNSVILNGLIKYDENNMFRPNRNILKM